MKSRVEEAVNKFESGYNCAQAVFATYADLFGMTEEDALKLASPMGGGMGRMREVCGTVSAMALLEGLKAGNGHSNKAEESNRDSSWRKFKKRKDSSSISVLASLQDHGLGGF